MAKNENNTRIFGDLTSAVYVGPKGTTAPIGLAAPAVGFVEIGWISEDGVEESLEQNAEVFRAWQGSTVLRRKVTQSDRTFKFQSTEENLVTHGLKYRGQTPTVATGIATTTVKDQTAQDTRAWIFDLVDGGVTKRFVIPAGDYTMTGSIQYKANSMTIQEYEVTPIGDYTEVTNDPAIVGA